MFISRKFLKKFFQHPRRHYSCVKYWTLLQCDITLAEYHNVTQPLMNVINVT